MVIITSTDINETMMLALITEIGELEDKLKILEAEIIRLKAEIEVLKNG